MWQCQKPTARIKHFFGNKAKERISKWVFKKTKAHQIFRKKKNISYPLIRTRFNLLIRSFALLDDILITQVMWYAKKKQKTKVIPGNMNDVNNYYIKFFFHFQYSLKCGQCGQRRIPKQKVCNECGQRGISKTVK